MAKHRAPRGQCFYCDTHFSPIKNAPKSASVDHVYPRNTPLPPGLRNPGIVPTQFVLAAQASGRNHPLNKVMACKNCNSAKGNMHPLVWLTKLTNANGAKRLSSLLLELGVSASEIDRALTVRTTINHGRN